MKEIFKRAWAQILLALAFGILLISYDQQRRCADLIHHLGTAFIVAAIVTAFWHLREVSEVIEKYVTSILLDYSYLTKLKLPALVALRSKAAKAILENTANNPKYKRDELETWIDDLLYKRLLPGEAPSSGLYRENYVDHITVEYLTLEEALRKEGSPISALAPAELGSFVMRVTSTTHYTVISPRLAESKDSGYPFWYSATGRGLTNFPMDKLQTLLVGNDQKSATKLAITISGDEQGKVIYKAEPKSFKFENGACKIWMRLVEYKSINESFSLNTMSHLTRNLRTSIYQVGQGPRLVFVGQMIATPLEETQTECHEPHGAWLEYDGWLFEDHGYHFYWFPSAEEEGIDPSACLDQVAEKPKP